MSNTVTVDHEGGDRFSASMRSHRLVVDQPEADGGGGSGPTPTELFVASLASCVAFYVRRYLVRHGLSEEGLSVSASYELASRPARVGSVDLALTLAEEVPEDRRDALLAVAHHCTVHNSLVDPPSVSIDLVPQTTSEAADAARRGRRAGR